MAEEKAVSASKKAEGGLHGREPFIPEELRPLVLPERDRHPPLEPGVPPSAIRTRIYEVLGKLRASRLWIGTGSSSDSFSEGTFVPSTDVDSATLDGQAVLLNWRDGRYYTLNPVGSTVWEFLGEGKTLVETTARVCERFDVSSDAARRDIAQLMREMEKSGLVVRKDGV